MRRGLWPDRRGCRNGFPRRLQSGLAVGVATAGLKAVDEAATATPKFRIINVLVIFSH